LEVITNWLYKAFRKDKEKWKLSVMALFNRSEPVFSELMQLEGTENWRRYVRSACTIGDPVVFLVQFVSNVQLNEELDGEGQSSHQGGEEEEGGHEEEGGEKDGGVEERGVKQLVWLMGEKKTPKYRGGTMERSMTMNVHWKMTPQMMWMNPLCQVTGRSMISHSLLSIRRSSYANSREVKGAVKRWSTLTLNREFRVLKSSPVVYDVRCVKPDSLFRVHAYKGNWKDY
jgi:hypothetical protein